MANDDCVAYGSALEPIEEEEITTKKPITIYDQVAKDEQGRRRFHGAFTGGFSAGYYNTVGSKEGWTPSTFKSSRSDRTSGSRGQNATDFMDSEDLGAFGIAPQVLKQAEEFSTTEKQTSRKRTKARPSDGPIPGVPVLQQIIEPVKETIGIRILVKMGWRPGQGVGPRVAKTKKKSGKKGKQKGEKKKGDKQEEEEPVITEDVDMTEVVNQKVYGCQLPTRSEQEKVTDGEGEESSSSEDDFDAEVLYAPEDVESPLCNPKVNRFGLGYKGLERLSGSGHIDLFGQQLKFKGVDSGGKRVGMTDEAFGIGAFEEPDEDVYNKDDMTAYDFELETAEERKLRKAKEAMDKAKKKHKDSCIGGYHFAKTHPFMKKYFPPPRIPPDFEPIHKQRKSRFEKAQVQEEKEADAKKRGLGRHALTVQERQVLLGEEPLPSIDKVKSEPAEEEAPKAAELGAKKLPPEEDPSIKERVERIKKFVQVLQAHSDPSAGATAQPAFQPFAKNPEKQERYDKYLTLVAAGFQDCLKDLQPLQMTEWEKMREMQEFERARDIYKPLAGVMSSRFVSAKSHDISHIVPDKEVHKEKAPTEDPKVAARLGLFGKLTHVVVEWHPDKLVCKRFNIKDPFPDSKFVGLRGSSLTKRPGFDPAIPDTSAPPPVVSSTPTPPQKKSLFDNLDFSKPPPGLLGAKGMRPSEGTDEENVPKYLDFQNALKAEEVEEQENIPEKAPLDLFKQIFAESSDSESEDEAIIEQIPSQKVSRERTDVSKSESISGSRSTGGKILADKRYDKDARRRRDSDEERFHKLKRSVFDDLDFTRLNHRESTARKSESGKESGGAEILRESNGKEEAEEDTFYGPKAPTAPLQLSASSTTTKLSSSHHPTSTSSSSASTFKSTSFHSHPSRSSAKLELKTEEVVWVEKEAVSQSRSKKSKKHSTKKTKKSKSKKTKKHKEKKSQKHKSKKSKHHGKEDAHCGSLSNSSDDESDSSSSSIEIHGSLNQKALLTQLKEITRSHLSK